MRSRRTFSECRIRVRLGSSAASARATALASLADLNSQSPHVAVPSADLAEADFQPTKRAPARPVLRTRAVCSGPSRNNGAARGLRPER